MLVVCLLQPCQLMVFGFQTDPHWIDYYGPIVKDDEDFYCSDCRWRYLNAKNKGNMGTVH